MWPKYISSLPQRPKEGWICYLRKAMGITQVQLTKRANLSLSCIIAQEKKIERAISAGAP